jgi:ABC-type multidrug transport system fused ATPase/permease subunit
MSSPAFELHRSVTASDLIAAAASADAQQRAMVLEELVELPADHEPAAAHADFAAAWAATTRDFAAAAATAASSAAAAGDASEADTEERDPPSVAWACLVVGRWDFFWALLHRIAHDGSTIAMAFVLRGFVVWLNRSDAELAATGRMRYEGFAWVAGLAAVVTVLLISFSLSQYYSFTGLQRVQAALVTAVYEKTLLLRADVLARERGKIVALHSSESSALRNQPFLFATLTSVPTMIGIIIALVFFVGFAAALAAAGLVLVFSLVQNRLTDAMSASRAECLARADVRLRAVSEFVQGIKLVKLMGWGDMFAARVGVLRDAEVAALQGVYWFRSGIIALSHSVPPLLQLVVFGTVTAMAAATARGSTSGGAAPAAGGGNATTTTTTAAPGSISGRRSASVCSRFP